MKDIIEILTKDLSEAFTRAGYDMVYGKVTRSNRPDIADYQCNGAMAAAGAYSRSPFQIATEVAKHLRGDYGVEVIKPGFINITLSDKILKKALNHMDQSARLGVALMIPRQVVIDYGGPNVAKPLHVGHLRAAIIGESVKRIYRFLGHEITGDIHLGDWGLQIGLVIEELKQRKPEMCYFDENHQGAYPEEAPFQIHELSEIYPTASLKSKSDEDYLKAARINTARLQKGHPGYTALWRHISQVSIDDLKKNYGNLNVFFDLWNGESHAMAVIPDLVNRLKNMGLTQVDDGALLVPVAKETDKRPMPPMILLKSDGAALYSTTDLATIYQRVAAQDLDEIIYVVDKRQELHFEQVFRAAKLAQIVKEDLSLNFIGFGTMNGTDGKPFKTRDGGVMKLEDLIIMLRSSVKEKVFIGREDYSAAEVDDIAIKVGLAALKYGDLINISTKDYIFDLDRFATFEGKTGPYILYSIVRIKSILKKAGHFNRSISAAGSDIERKIQLKLIGFNQMMLQAYSDKAPNRICEYAFELSNLFNSFYHDTKILSEDNKLREGHLTLLTLILKVLEQCLDLLGIESIDKM